MTHDELMALPDITPQIGHREIAGQKVPQYAATADGAVYQGPTDGMFTDNDGVQWMVGWLDGKRVRRRLTGQFVYRKTP